MSSSTSVVAADKNNDSTPRGATSMSSSTSVVDAAENTDSTPKGGRHRRLLQLRWWLLPEILAASPRGPAIDVFFNFSGGYCQKY
jgi:hypothetical protein